MDHQVDSRCAVCGNRLEPGTPCERCAQRHVFRLVRREMLLLLCLSVVAAGVYFCTLMLANSNRAMKESMAGQWFRRGIQDLNHGRADDAVAAFRKAAVNDLTNRAYVIALAKALEAAARNDEARKLLLQARESTPEDPEINVELARIWAKENNVPDALRYYHNALYGIWRGEEVDIQRMEVRRELIQFLLSNNAREQALAETMALSAHAPETSAARLQVAGFFLQLNDFAGALQNYEWVLHHEPRNKLALKGAGEAAFKKGNYARAVRWLTSLIHPDPSTTEMLQISKLILASDPLEPRLTESERLRRAAADLEIAGNRLADCSAKQAPGAAAQSMADLLGRLEAQKQILKTARKRHDTTVAFSSLDLIYEVENLMVRFCGSPSIEDKALLQVAQKSRGIEP